MKSEWQFNASTGVDILDEGNKRILRQRYADGSFLYQAQFWGDYSLRYPMSSGWTKSLQQAYRDLERLERYIPSCEETAHYRCEVGQ